jgi:hypothetical protein
MKWHINGVINNTFRTVPIRYRNLAEYSSLMVMKKEYGIDAT